MSRPARRPARDCPLSASRSGSNGCADERAFANEQQWSVPGPGCRHTLPRPWYRHSGSAACSSGFASIDPDVSSAGQDCSGDDPAGRRNDVHPAGMWEASEPPPSGPHSSRDRRHSATGLAHAQQAAASVSDENHVAVTIPRAADAQLQADRTRSAPGPPRRPPSCSLPPASNAMKRLSGDQNGGGATEHLGAGHGADVQRSASSRTQSRGGAVGAEPKNARWRPSGEMLKFPGPANSTAGGIRNRIGSSATGCSNTAGRPAARGSPAAMPLHPSRSRRRAWPARRASAVGGIELLGASDNVSSANARSRGGLKCAPLASSPGTARRCGRARADGSAIRTETRRMVVEDRRHRLRRPSRASKRAPPDSISYNDAPNANMSAR